MKINSSIINGIINSVEKNGIFIDAILKNKERETFTLENEMTNADDYFSLVTEIRNQFPDIESYSNLIQYVNVLDMGILGHFINTCKSIFIAYDRMIKYQLLISNFINMKYNLSGNEIHWALQMPYHLLKDKYNMEAIADFEIIFRFKIEESLSNRTPQPKKIELFQNSTDLNSSRIKFFSKKYNCEVVPNKFNNVIIYNVSDINKEIPYKNFELYKYLDILLLKKIPDLYKKEEYKNSIKSILLNNLDKFPLSIDEVSRQLFMSSRKLQQILQNEETSFQKILNEVKIIFAIEQLKRKKELSDIAFKLGYKELNSFIRFFTLHTNCHPGKYSTFSKEKQNEISKNFK